LAGFECDIGRKFERTKTAYVRFQEGEIGAGIASTQPAGDDASVRKCDSDALLRANTFTGGQDQIVAPDHPAGSNAAPGVNGHDAGGGALHGFG